MKLEGFMKIGCMTIYLSILVGNGEIRCNSCSTPHMTNSVRVGHLKEGNLASLKLFKSQTPRE